MTSKGALVIRFIGDTKDFDGANKHVQSGFSKIGKAAAVGFAAAGAAAIKFTKDAAVLDSQQREVVTLFGETGKAAEKSLGQVRDITKKVSNEFGIAQETLTSGLYSAISAGVPKKNALTFMQVASKAAIAGVTDVETAVDGITTTINAFGLKASDAEKISDSMFTAVKGGKTTFKELSDSLFNVAPAAAAAGVSFQEVNAGIAALTAGGTPTSVATTQLRAALTGLQAPSKDLDAIFQKLGFANAQVAIKSKGLGFALDAVKKASGGSNGQLQKLLGSSEAVAAANVLAGTGAKKFADEMRAQGEAAGATGKAYDVVNKGAARQFEILKTRIQNVGIEIGQKLLPIVVSLGGWFNEEGLPAIRRFGDYVSTALVPALKQVGEFIAGTVVPAATALVKWMVKWQDVLIPVAAGVVAIVAALKVYRGIVIAVTAVQAALNVVLAANPIGLVVLALVGLGAALVVAYKKSETFRNVVNGALNGVRAAAQSVGSFFTQKIPAFFQQAWNGAQSKTSNGIAAITGFVGGIPGKISGALSSLGGIVGGLFAAAMNAGKDKVTGFATAVSDKIADVVGFFRDLPGKIKGVFSGAGTMLTDIGKNIISGLVSGLESAKQWVIDKIQQITDMIPGWVKKRLGIASPSKVMKALGKFISQGLADGISEGGSAVTAAMAKVSAKIADFYGDKFPKSKKKAAEATRTFMASLKDEAGALRVNLQAQRANNTALDDARQKLADARRKVDDYATSVRDATVAFGGLVGLGRRESEDGVVSITGTSIIDDLTKKVADANEFAALIGTLTAQGLNQTNLDQLIQAGVDGGLATAQALAAGGPAAIAEINALTGQLQAVATSLGASTAQHMYGAGVQAAQGLVDGFQSLAATLAAAGQTLAEQMVSAMEDILGGMAQVQGGGGRGGRGRRGRGWGVPRLAMGGITTGPMLAVIGDNPGGREAVIPLSGPGAFDFPPAGGGGRQVLEIRSGGSRLDDLLVEVLRAAIYKQGGNVQVVLGH